MGGQRRRSTRTFKTLKKQGRPANLHDNDEGDQQSDRKDEREGKARAVRPKHQGAIVATTEANGDKFAEAGRRSLLDALELQPINLLQKRPPAGVVQGRGTSIRSHTHLAS